MQNDRLNHLKRNLVDRSRDLAIWGIYHSLRGAEAARRRWYAIPQAQRLAGIVLGTVFAAGFASGLLTGQWLYAGQPIPRSVLPPDALAVYQMPRLSAPMNILLLGTGAATAPSPFPAARSGEPAADLAWVLTLDPQRRRLGVVAIPSDTLVEIPNQGFAKIKFAPQAGGTELTRQLVEKMMGVKIDRHVRVDMNTAEQLIEWMGGMDLYVERNLQYVDRAGRTNIDLRKGWQPLNGHQVMDYLRFRFDNLGEIGRLRRQQRFVHLALRKLLQPAAVGKLPAMAELGRKLVDTDLSSRELTRVVGTLGTLTPQDVRMAILPGTFGPSTNWSSSHNLWLPDRRQIDTLVSRLWGPEPVQKFMRGQTVSVLTTVGDRRLNDLAVQHLVEQGFRVAHLYHVKPAVFPGSQIIDRTFGSSPAALSALQEVMPAAQVNYGDDGTFQMETDYAVVLGTDYAPATLQRKPVAAPSGGPEMAAVSSEILTTRH